MYFPLDIPLGLKSESESSSIMPHSLKPHGLYSPWNFPRQNTGVDSRSLLQGIFPTQGSNPGLPHCSQILYPLSHQGHPRTLEWVAISFSNAWKWKVKGKSLSCVRLLATPWTAAYQAPLSMGFSRQEYWSGLPLPSPFIGVGCSQKTLRVTLMKFHCSRKYSLFSKITVNIDSRETQTWRMSCSA